jgi:hypothetical protein
LKRLAGSLGDGRINDRRVISFQEGMQCVNEDNERSVSKVKRGSRSVGERKPAAKVVVNLLPHRGKEGRARQESEAPN